MKETVIKRFHLHLNVDDLTANIGFYSKLYGTRPARVEADDAKWTPDAAAATSASWRRPAAATIGSNTGCC